MEHVIKKITDYKNELDHRKSNNHKKGIGREEFTLLLGGISSFRRAPGIPCHMGFETLYHCETRENEKELKNHLYRMFGIADKDTLMRACYDRFHGSIEYEQFMTFWAGAPLFDIKRLNPDGRKNFEKRKEIASKFYPLVKEKGFYAWDINERIGLCRTAVAAGIISEGEFWELTDNWVKMAQVFYHSFEEYAYSCLCGAAYFMSEEDDEAGVEQFLNINLNILNELFDAGHPWDISQWYQPPNREYASLVERNLGCFVTKKAMESGKIGYMYREEPEPNCPDSGWRFFVGDEDDDYVNHPDNVVVVGLDTVCSINPGILAYIYAGYGRSFGYKNGAWSEE